MHQLLAVHADRNGFVYLPLRRSHSGASSAAEAGMILSRPEATEELTLLVRELGVKLLQVLLTPLGAGQVASVATTPK